MRVRTVRADEDAPVGSRFTHPKPDGIVMTGRFEKGLGGDRRMQPCVRGVVAKVVANFCRANGSAPHRVRRDAMLADWATVHHYLSYVHMSADNHSAN